MSGSGNMIPTSRTRIRPSTSMQAQLRPISPRPPRNTTRTAPDDEPAFSRADRFPGSFRGPFPLPGCCPEVPLGWAPLLAAAPFAGFGAVPLAPEPLAPAPPERRRFRSESGNRPVGGDQRVQPRDDGAGLVLELGRCRWMGQPALAHGQPEGP